MAQPWKIIERVPTDEGILELRQRGLRDFLITIGPQVLMNSLANRSEVLLGQMGCGNLKEQDGARVLVGGLGMGFTLKGVLESLPPAAEVTVAELNPVVPAWCRGPLAGLTGSAVTDSRVTVEIVDVARLIRATASAGGDTRFDAIILDLYRGPHPGTHHHDDPLYGLKAIQHAKAALKPGGMFAIWGEQYDEAFVKRLQSAGFKVRVERPGRGGYRHAVFLAKVQII